MSGLAVWLRSLARQVESVMVADRAPGFIILGAMKAGTTTLHRWLGDHPNVTLPGVKEMNHLCSREAVSRGPSSYFERFPRLGEGQMSGESSPAYLRPPGNALAAATIRHWLPNTALVAVLRDPLERLRSHYAHEVQRARERRTLAEALEDPRCPYVTASLYGAALRPYFGNGLGDRLLVVRLEDLAGDDGVTWRRVLDHIGLSPVERPTEVHNRTAEKVQFTPAMRLIFDRGLAGHADRLPLPLRRLGRRVLVREGPRRVPDEPFPMERVLDRFAHDLELLSSYLGDGRALWDLPTTS